MCATILYHNKLQQICLMKGSSMTELQELRRYRRDLHRIPELDFDLPQTIAYIEGVLAPLACEVTHPCPSCVCAFFDAGVGAAHATAIRADMDALPIAEATGAAFASTHPGKMHACGHDGHMAMALAAATFVDRTIREQPGAIKRNVLFVFQPAEEKLKGAKYMLEHNVFSQYKPSAVFGLHNLPELPVGTVGVKAGPLMSFKDGFRIKFIGKSGHTSTPQKNVDPTVAIASLVMSLETIISRNVGPLESAVLTVCSIQSGTPFTTTIDDAEITGNIRSLEEDVRERILKRVELMAHGTAEEFGCACELELIPITRGVFNSESLLKAASDAGAAVFGVENVKVPSVNMASEDFSLLSEGVPSFFYFLGSGVPGEKPYLWHNPMFHAAHDTPVCGAALLAQSVFSAQDNL